MPSRLPLTAALLLAALPATPGLAQTTPNTTTDATAQALEHQLHDQLATTLGPDTPLPARPVLLTPEGDHYRATIPNNAGYAEARPIGGARWSLDAIHLPTPTRRDQALAARPGQPTPPPLSITTSYGQQTGEATLDPTLATPSTGALHYRDVAATVTGGAMPFQYGLRAMEVTAALTPQDARLADVTQTATGNDLDATFTPPGSDRPAHLAVARLAASVVLNHLDVQRAWPLWNAMQTASKRVTADQQRPPVIGPDGKPHPPPIPPQTFRPLLVAFDGTMSGAQIDESADGLIAEVAGIPVALDHVALRFGGAATAGQLDARMSLVADGLHSALVPPDYAVLLPTHIAIAPHVGGIELAALDRMLMQATAPTPPGTTPQKPDLAALFGDHGLTGTIDTLELDVGGAHLTGTGAVQVASPSQYSGRAEVTATGLDDLIAKLQQNPQMSRVIPVLLLIRGLGRPQGDHLVWDITTDGTTLKVNGIDLQALAAMGQPPRKRP